MGCGASAAGGATVARGASARSVPSSSESWAWQRPTALQPARGNTCSVDASVMLSEVESANLAPPEIVVWGCADNTQGAQHDVAEDVVRQGADGEHHRRRSTLSVCADVQRRPSNASSLANSGVDSEHRRFGRMTTPSDSPSWASSAGLSDDVAHTMYSRTTEIVEAYNGFWGHVSLRTGWRQAPFTYEEVQAPFFHAGYMVATIRARLGAGASAGTRRPIDGAAQAFLWGWPRECSPGSSQENFRNFVRGLVFATLTDGNGLIDGLNSEDVNRHVSSQFFGRSAGDDWETLSSTTAGDDVSSSSTQGGAD